MHHLLRHLVLALLLAAVAAPRGIALHWCACDGPDAGCCAAEAADIHGGCCGGGGCSEDEDLSQVVSGDECGCCHTYEVDESEPRALPARAEVVPLPPVAVADGSSPRSFPPAPARAALRPRAPPRRPAPAWLRPGAAPLRL